MHHERRAGFALPIVLIVTAVILAAYVSVAALSAVSARAAAAGERASLQALLVAEAGHDTFLAEYAALPSAQRSISSWNVDALNGWLSASSLATFAMPSGTATRTVVAVSPSRNAFTVQSRGVVGGSSASVLSEYRLATTQGRVNVNAPAALTSYPAVNAGRNIDIVGMPLSSVSPYRSGVTRTTAAFDRIALSTAPLPVSVSDSAGDLVDAGDFVRIGGQTYRVVASSSDSMDVVPLITPTLSETVPANTGIDLVDVGLSSAYLAGNTLRVNRPGRVSEGGRIRVGSHEAVVQDVAADGTVTVTWVAGAPPTGLPEGTPLAVEVYGVYTAGTFSAHRNNPHDIRAIDFGSGASLPAPAPMAPAEDDRVDSLFYRTFGVTKASFLAGMPSGNVLSRAQDLPNPLGGQTYVVTSGNLQQSICGTGIVVVIASDVVYNASNCEFRGLLYVVGDLRMQGNVNMFGAIVVEGLVTTDDETEVNGAGQDPRIQYDSNALLDAARSFPVSGGLQRESGTWRQR